MNREQLERMTKEDLMELADRQSEVIDSLNEQRYNASAVIEHLVRATHDMHNLRYRDSRQSYCQDRLDDFVREMYGKYPIYLVSAEYPNKSNEEKEHEEELPDRSAVILNLASMRDEARLNGYDGYVKTLSRAIELLEGQGCKVKEGDE